MKEREPAPEKMIPIEPDVKTSEELEKDKNPMPKPPPIK